MGFVHALTASLAEAKCRLHLNWYKPVAFKCSRVVMGTRRRPLRGLQSEAELRKHARMVSTAAVWCAADIHPAGCRAEQLSGDGREQQFAMLAES